MKRQRNSSISNSRETIRLIVFLVGFAILAGLFGKALLKVNKEATYYAEEKWQDYYSKEKNSIDAIILGPSTAYHTLDPNILAESGTEAFNMGSPLQKPKETYHVLKELLKTQKPSYIIYDFYWGVCSDEKYLNAKLFNYQQMKPSVEKIKYFLNVFEPDQYGYAAMPMMVYHNSTEKVLDVLAKRVDNFPEKEAYLAKYRGRGFEAQKEQWDGTVEGFDPEQTAVPEFGWSESELKWLDKIYKLCKNNGIELIMITSPLSIEYMEAYNQHWYNYGNIHKFMVDWTEKRGIKYKDYNFLDIGLKPTDYTDTHHLNENGAKIVTQEFIKDFSMGK
ncbi:MAG: hypothetical protein GXZ11_03240 [Tissierellia bacterium]|nr:hypothetical protein [Tissierellia bacterium]